MQRQFKKTTFASRMATDADVCELLYFLSQQQDVTDLTASIGNYNTHII